MDKAYSAEYVVTIGDINYGGHLGNERSLQIFHDARYRFLQSLGFSEMDIGNGRGVIIVEATVHFLKEILVHDVLETRVWLAECNERRLPMQYEVKRKTDGKVVLSGSTLLLAFDYQTHKVARVPAVFLDAYRQVYGEPEI
jgi:acyl-CoA thioesterase FadM